MFNSEIVENFSCSGNENDGCVTGQTKILGVCLPCVPIVSK